MKRLLVATLGLLLIVVAVSGVVFANAQGGSPRFDPLGVSSSDATALPPSLRPLWEAKKQRFETAVAAGLPTPSNPDGVLKPVPAEAWPEGLFTEVNSFGAWVFTSAWGAELPEQHLRVYAGYPSDDPDSGVIVIRYTYKDFRAAPTTGNRIIQVPSSKGALRVIAGDAARSVRLLSNSGRPYRLDVATGNVTELAASSGAAACCSLALDANSNTSGVQPTGGYEVNSIASLAVIAGEDLGDLSAFNFKLIYDDTRLAPVAAAGGPLEGNPDFNQQALGAQWTCSLPAGSATADIDPETGPGHGVAFLSCFTTSAAPVITNGAVVATLLLQVLAQGESSIEIGEANFGHADGVEIGSCAPVTTTEMTCVGATINGQ